MKKLAAVIAALVLILASAVSASAADLSIVKVTPKDGAKGMQPSNMAIKVKFSADMRGGESADTANADKFVITDPEGKEIEKTLVHSDKYPDEIWVVLTGELASNTEYTVSIKEGIVSADGTKTSEAKTTTFKTRNVKTDSIVSMVFMFGMVAFMIFMGQRETKKQAAQTDVYYALDAAKKLNPYKIAKQKGISVEEAIAYCDKEKAKAQKAVDKANAEKAKAAAAKEAEMAAAAARIEAEMAAAHDASVFKVKGPRSVKAAGGKIPRSVRNRSKAKEEAARAAEKQRAQNAKGKKSKK